MEFLELAKKRYSCRNYKEKEVPEELIEKIIEAGRVAPTARNTMPVSVYIIKSKEALKKASEFSPCLFNAPLAFLICFDTEKMSINESRGHLWYGDMDSTICATHMMLEVFDLGLGCCFVERFDQKMASKAFDIPENIIPAVFMPVGYAVDDDIPNERHFIRREYSDFCKTV